MSNPFNLKVGSIIHEMESNIDHRVIYENRTVLLRFSSIRLTVKQ